MGNVINPDEVVDQYGADTMRLYEMFMGDFEQAAPWQTSAIAGCNRFLDRVWALSDKLVEGEGYRPQLETLLHQTIKKVGADIEGLKMNTAIAQLMTLVNALYDNGGATRAEFETVVQLLNPFAPHMTEELWEKLGHSHDEQLAYYPWPKYEEAKCVESTVEIAVQVNGKVKARLKVAADITSEDAIAAAKADPAVAEALSGKTVVMDLNGHSIRLEYAAGVKPNNGSVFYIGGKKGNLTINDSSEGQTGAVYGSDKTYANKVTSAVRAGNYGRLTINGGHFYGTSEGTSCIFVYTSMSSGSKATVTINGGKFETATPSNGTYYVLNHQDNATAGCTITVNGGSFKNYNPGVTTVDPVNAKTGKITLGNGCTTTSTVDGSDTWYTVSK